MLSKCANPDCSNSFRYLHEGKLFRLETGIGGKDGLARAAESEVRKSSRHLEFFWLCDNCAARMTLAYQRGVGITVRPLGWKKFGSTAA